ncbi:hypothetical protein [Parasitella parasitica]|uniref:Uncharacterized protein n=1 Tax=Parasitella parasitica TaxID=35722 RepID=A0A0B7MXB1_9FUNG|nr:hypothetical protein [Parasitella parasitica]
MYFATDNSDDKTIKLIQSQVAASAAEIRSLKNRSSDYDDLVNSLKETREELKRSRELVSLLHEKLNDMKIEASMTSMDNKRRGI